MKLYQERFSEIDLDDWLETAANHVKYFGIVDVLDLDDENQMVNLYVLKGVLKSILGLVEGIDHLNLDDFDSLCEVLKNNEQPKFRDDQYYMQAFMDYFENANGLDEVEFEFNVDFRFIVADDMDIVVPQFLTLFYNMAYAVLGIEKRVYQQQFVDVHSDLLDFSVESFGVERVRNQFFEVVFTPLNYIGRRATQINVSFMDVNLYSKLLVFRAQSSQNIKHGVPS